MALDFKLGLLSAELDLPLPIAEELPTDSEDAVEEAEMADGSFKYNFKTNVRRTWLHNWEDLLWTEIATLNTIDGYKVALNYINGYMGITGATVVVAYYSGPTLQVETSGHTYPRYRATMILKGV